MQTRAVLTALIRATPKSTTRGNVENVQKNNRKGHIMNDPRIIIEKGRLTGEPEIKQTKTGKTMLVFTVAGNGSHKDKTTGEYVDDCQIFVRCTIWDTALFLSMQQLLHKGTLVRLDTAFDYQVRADRNGEPHVYFDARFPEISVLPAKAKQQQSYQSPATTQTADGNDPWGTEF